VPSQNATARSKFLSLVLRHRPELIGLALDPHGWADIKQLLSCARAHGVPLTHALLLDAVAKSDKQRFALSDDGQRIRAQQGHSIDIDLQLEPQTTPNELFHGTATRFATAIRQQGLIAGTRQYVHLSGLESTAVAMGQRHGKPLVLRVHALAMHAAGFPFFLTANGVWLTKTVPVKFLEFP